MTISTLACSAAWPRASLAQFANGGYQFPGWSNLAPAPLAASRLPASPIPGSYLPTSQLPASQLPATLSDGQHRIEGGPSVGPPGAPEPGWTIQPYVNVSEAYNDNIFQSSAHKASDFITYVTPGVNVTGDISRVQARLFYAPTGIVYAEHGSQNLVAQRLNASANVTLVPETAFVLLRGFAAVQPTFGGLPSGSGFGLSPSASLDQSGAFLTRSTATQSQSYSIAPYAVHRFGSFGTVKAGASYSYTNSTPLGNAIAFPVTVGASGGSLNTTNEVLQFASGEDFGRWRDLGLATGTQFAGTGVTSGAYQYIVSNEIGYAIRDDLVLFGELGWEYIRFSGTPATRIDDGVWAGGVHWTPDPDSTVTIGYGHQYGTDSLLFNAGFAPTARTRLFGQYQSGLGTNLTQLQAYALATDVDPFGASVDPTTGAPLNLAGGTIGVTGNTNLYRTKTFSATAVLDLDRDQVSIQLSWQDQQLLATTSQIGATASSGLSAIAGWRHQLNPATVASVYASYGRQTGSRFFSVPGDEVEDTYGAQVALRYNFTATLSGIVQYTFTDRTANIPGLSFTQNVILIGLTKQF